MKISDIVNEADHTTSMDYLGSLGKSSPNRGDPVIDPGIPGFGRGGGSSGRTGASVWRGSGGEKMSVPRPLQKPRVEPPTAAQRQAQELLKGKGFAQSPADVRNTNVGAKVWRRGEPESTSTVSVTPQEKLSAAAQTQAKATGEPVVTFKPGGLASRMLDKFFPEPKQQIEPKLQNISEPPMRAVEPKSNMEKNIEYWNKAMPTDTIGGKIVDKLMGRKDKVDEEKKPIDFDQYLKDPNVQKMLNLIGKAEGADYDTIVGGKKKITDFSAHPNIVGLRTAQGPSKAAGKYQITKNTYDRYAKKLGLRDFSPETQDKIAVQILHDTGALKDIVKGKFKSAVEKAGGTWMSLPSSKIIQGRGPRSWDWVAKNLQDVGTTALATAVGAKNATAADLPAVQPNTAATAPEPPRVIKQMPPDAPAAKDTTLKSFIDKATNPKFDLPTQIVNPFIQPAMKATDYLTQKLSGKDKDDISPEQEREQERRMSDIGDKWRQEKERKAAEPKPPEVKVPAEPAAIPKSSVRQEFEKEFAKQRAAQGAGGTFDWTNPATGKTSKFTTDYAVEPKSKVAESINTELTEILKLAGRN